MRVLGGWRGAGKPREENGQTLEREALAAKHPPDEFRAPNSGSQV